MAHSGHGPARLPSPNNGLSLGSKVQPGKHKPQCRAGHRYQRHMPRP
jgi:hypothetical protein